MDDLWSLPSITIILSAILMCIMLMYAIVYHQERGVRYFVWVLVCRVVYAGCVILEISRSDLQTKLFFRNIEQTALLFMVPLMVLFVLDLVGKDKWLRLRWSLSLLALFACWAVVIWAEPYWHVINRTQELINGHLVTTKTPYSLVFNLLCYAIIACCVFVLVRYIRSTRPEIRGAGMWLLLFGCIPVLVEMMKLFKPNLSPWLLPLSVYSGICGIIMFWIILRKRLFSSVPMARNIVVETMHEGMLIMNTDGNIIDSNRFARLLLEVDDNHPILGRSYGEVLTAWPQWQSACARMEECRVEISTRIGHEKKSYIVNVYPFFTQRQRKLGTISIIIDITEKQQALEQIARLNQMKDQLFTAVSHDIRNPLAVQVNLLEMLEQDNESSRQANREVFHALSEQIRNTYSMVENLVEWFRGQKEGIVLHPESLIVSEAVEEACRLLVLNCEAKQLTLHIHVDEEIRVHTDREVLILVIRNLLSNAIKYSIQGGVILIRAIASGGRVEITVQDDGIGMSEEQISHVFDDTRFDSTIGTAGEKGTGLGLLVSRQFLRMSDGHLKVRSKLGSGSSFTIVLEDGDLR
ncbi:Adaptive-response sensory-kinase SasA [Paenibacillus plantiphilus]|uniref:histidine kinase n=1 Tax=Paenibacillus plantiphilus TaxID=2905650 RepID=A0ABN8GKI9_9BACL|nr:histidine kinase N-terminal 7TM domain-containing protein [Paenibacillus plantiphilus]CAH1205524.1 Adaptive-response sensory-kinase SasA [Paenibacillus plantiphilus]